jgi:hypothetical protein
MKTFRNSYIAKLNKKYFYIILFAFFITSLIIRYFYFIEYEVFISNIGSVTPKLDLQFYVDNKLLIDENINKSTSKTDIPQYKIYTFILWNKGIHNFKVISKKLNITQVVNYSTKNTRYLRIFIGCHDKFYEISESKYDDNGNEKPLLYQDTIIMSFHKEKFELL